MKHDPAHPAARSPHHPLALPASAWIAAALLASLAFAASYAGSSHIPLWLFHNLWHSVYLGADLSRTFANITDPASNQDRNQLHPIYSLVGLCLTRLMTALGAADLYTAVRLHTALAAALWSAALLIPSVMITRSTATATLLTAIGMMSAASVYFWTVPETFPIGGLFVLLALILAAASSVQQGRIGLTILAAAGTLAFSLSNYITGLLLCCVRHRGPRLIVALVGSFLVVLVLWLVQVI